jgi:hypothetical protein
MSNSRSKEWKVKQNVQVSKAPGIRNKQPDKTPRVRGVRSGRPGEGHKEREARHRRSIDRGQTVIPGPGKTEELPVPPERLPFGTPLVWEVDHFKPVPVRGESRQPARPDRIWRIVFASPNSAHPLLGLEIHDDIVLGRDTPGQPPPDVDLAPLDAAKQGVSRRHALLRPTNQNLYLIDLGSTNGSYLNSVPIGAGVARALNNYDIISLGRLHLAVKIEQRPPKSQ